MAKPTLEYLVTHITPGYLKKTDYKKIPYLKDNNGSLPPFIIAFGDSRRVTKACEVLKLEKPLLLHEAGEQLIGLKGRGRVHIAIGIYKHNGREIPLTLVETQMGMPAVEIILRELIAHTSRTYRFKDKIIGTKSIFLIRAGTAGGINCGKKEKLHIGDMINSTFSLGWSGALLESLAGLDFSDQKVVSRFKKEWENRGFAFTKDGKFPMAESSENIVSAIDLASENLGIKSLQGGNFSKDSLYAELDGDTFVNLRKKYGIIGTEMEQMALFKVASDFAKVNIRVDVGLISGVIGVLPETSVGSSPNDKKKIENVENNAIRTAANALIYLSEGASIQ